MTKHLFKALLNSSTAHANRSREIYQQLNLSDGQPKVLYILRTHDGCLQKELAERCNVRQSTLAVLLEKIEEKGLIYKETTLVSGGKRAYKIWLTEKGQEVAQVIYEKIEELEAISMEGFTPEERQLLISLLCRVTDNLTK